MRHHTSPGTMRSRALTPHDTTQDYVWHTAHSAQEPTRREYVDVAFGDVAFKICENWVFKEKNVRLNSAGCEPHSRSDECFLFENPIFTLLKRHVRKRHVYRLPKHALQPVPRACDADSPLGVQRPSCLCGDTSTRSAYREPSIIPVVYLT